MSTPPIPEVPAIIARPVPPGDTYYERLAAPLAKVDGELGESLASREARRLAARLPAGYEPQSGADITFHPLLAYELALGMSSASAVFQKYGISIEQAQALLKTPAFITTVKKYKEEVTANGVSFKLKAKIQAEDLLTHSYLLATDPDVPAAVRADLIKWTGKMAGFEPSTQGEKGGGAGSAFQLNITFAGMPGSLPVGRVIDSTAVLIEEGPR